VPVSCRGSTLWVRYLIWHCAGQADCTLASSAELLEAWTAGRNRRIRFSELVALVNHATVARRHALGWGIRRQSVSRGSATLRCDRKADDTSPPGLNGEITSIGTTKTQSDGAENGRIADHGRVRNRRRSNVFRRVFPGAL